MSGINFTILNLEKSLKSLSSPGFSRLNKNSILSGNIKAKLAGTGFVVSSPIGDFKIETDYDFSIGEKVKFKVEALEKDLLSLKLIENESETKILKDIPPSKDLLFFSKKEIISSFKSFLKSLSIKDHKGLESEIKTFFDLIQNPDKISGESLKNAVKLLFGSSFKEFKNEIMKIMADDGLEDFILKKISLMGKKKSSEKEPDIIKTIENHKDLSLIKFAESSKFYFYIPFTDQFMKRAEFLYDSNRNDDEGEGIDRKRAVIKLDMSFLGNVLIDVILSESQNLKIDFFVEDELKAEILKNGFPLLHEKLKGSGFDHININVAVAKPERLMEPLVKTLFEEKNSNFNIVV